VTTMRAMFRDATSANQSSYLYAQYV